MRLTSALMLSIFLLFSCRHPYSVNENLLFKAKQIIESNPDSAYILLRTIEQPASLSNADYALYCLLFVQSTDKTFRSLQTDSLINVAISYFTGKRDPFILAKCYYYVGRINEELDKTYQAIECYLKAVEYVKDTNDYKLSFLIYSYLGNLYSSQEMYQEELEAQSQANYFSYLLDDSLYIAYSLRYIGVAYSDIGKEDSALIYYNRSLRFASENNLDFRSYLFTSISASYNQLNKYKEALHYVNWAISLQEDESEREYDYILKGNIFENIQYYDSAMFFYNKSLASDNLYIRVSAYKGLSNIEAKRNNFKKALYFNNLLLDCKDSIDINTKTEAIIKMQRNYQFTKLEKENHRLQIVEANKNNIIYRLIVLFVSVLLILSLIYFKIKIRHEQKIRQQEEQIKYDEEIRILCENELLELREKEAILRVDFFKRLNMAYIPFLIEGEKYTKRIKLTEEDWLNLEKNIDAAFNGFTIRLKKAYPQLDKEDIRFCCLIKMRLKLSELAEIYCIEKTSISKKKDRLKNKKMLIQDNRLLEDILRDF